MRVATFVSGFAAIGFASANGVFSNSTALVSPTTNAGPTNPGGDVIVTTTEVVTALTTFCPAPTQITQGTKTYTVTAPTTLTITDCPCTRVKTTTLSKGVPTYAAPSPGNATVTVITQTVPVLTTYCPAPTVVTQGSSKYTVTTPTTLTITNCPCTVVTTSTLGGAPPAGNTPPAPPAQGTPVPPGKVSAVPGAPGAAPPAAGTPAPGAGAPGAPAPGAPVSPSTLASAGIPGSTSPARATNSIVAAGGVKNVATGALGAFAAAAFAFLA